MSPKKILLVDDSDVALLAQRMILERTSEYEIILAKDGEEAIERACEERPDVILLDVMMPRMNGIEALEELRNREVTREIPIIMVSTRSEMKTVEAAFAGGCNDYVTKPVNAAELFEKLQNVLGQMAVRKEGDR